MSPEAHVFKGLIPGYGAGWRGDSALLEEEVHHWSGFWLLPVHSLCLPLGLEMWSLSSLHQPPAARPPPQISLRNQKSKKKKYPLPSTNSFGRGVWAQQQESKSAKVLSRAAAAHVRPDKVLSRAAAAHAHVRPNPLMLTVGMWCGVWSRGLGG